jgi:hypothetical protein
MRCLLSLRYSLEPGALLQGVPRNRSFAVRGELGEPLVVSLVAPLVVSLSNHEQDDFAIPAAQDERVH